MSEYFFREKERREQSRSIEADERIFESDVAIFARDDMKRNDDVDARPAIARNCPITRSLWHISRLVSRFPSRLAVPV